jgi:hypothetical protein
MERRQHLRVTQSLISQILSDDTNLFVVTGDLSANGIFLISKQCLPVDTAVTIEIALPDNSVSSLKGIVRRIIDTSAFIQNGMGIEIIEKDKNYVDFLNSILHGKAKCDQATPIGVGSEPSFSSIQAPEESFRKTRSEKRQNHRYLINEKEIEAMIGASHEAKVVDISAGGISFKTEEKLDHDKQYIIQLRSGDRSLTLKGAVRWISLNEYKKLCSRGELHPILRKELIPVYTLGMQFTDFHGNTQDEVMRFLDGLTKIDAVYHDKSSIDLSNLILSEFLETAEIPVEEHQEDKRSRHKGKESIGEKRKSSSRRDRKRQANLLKYPDKEALKDPKVTVREIQKIAKSHTITEETIKTIIQNKKWMNHSGIVSAIVSNPKTPPFIAAGLAKKLKKTDLKKLIRNKEVSEATRRAASDLLSHNA